MNNNMDDENKIIEYKCKFCGNNKAIIHYLKDVAIVKYIACNQCKKTLEYEVVGKTGKPRPEWLTNAQCPYCKSYDTKKISTSSKVKSVALFGIFAAGKVAKEWHCNTCKSDF